MPQLSMHSPVGALSVAEEDGAIVSLDWGWSRDQIPSGLLCEAIQQLQAYFDGIRTEFDLPMSPHGSLYHTRVWQSLAGIPFGRTMRYGRLADEVGGTARSVGMAVSRNPIPILIPCHRVIGVRSIGGGRGDDGVALKRFLLRLEGGFDQAGEAR